MANAGRRYSGCPRTHGAVSREHKDSPERRGADTPTGPRSMFLIRAHGRVGPMSRRPSGGRPSKGDRDLLVTRPARAVGDAVRARADAQGLTISEYIAAVLAEAHDLPQHAPRRDIHPAQEELPLSRTA